jgi:hypothetical protein
VTIKFTKGFLTNKQLLAAKILYYIYVMKKLLTTTAIILSLNCAAQDTTYFQRRNDLYMSIRTHVADSTLYKQHYSVLKAKRHRNDVIFTIAAGVLFGGISAWFWNK